MCRTATVNGEARDTKNPDFNDRDLSASRNLHDVLFAPRGADIFKKHAGPCAFSGTAIEVTLPMDESPPCKENVTRVIPHNAGNQRFR